MIRVQSWDSPVAPLVKNPPAVQETRVPSLGGEDPLEKEMAPLPSSAWESPWTEEPGGLESRGSKELDTTKQLVLYAVLLNLSPASSCCFGRPALNQTVKNPHKIQAYFPPLGCYQTFSDVTF